MTERTLAKWVVFDRQMRYNVPPSLLICHERAQGHVESTAVY